MVRSKQTKLNANLIKHILTLRYSPETKSKIPRLTWRNFTGKRSNISTDLIEKIITDNIKNNIKNSSNTKVAIALSGGVDSTLMMDLLTRSLPAIKIKALSVKFNESLDETKQAAHLAQKLDVDHQVVFLENYLEEIPQAISIVKLPIWDLHWYYLAKKAGTISKFIVSGDGGDELFGGYTFRYKKFLSLIKKNSSTQNKIISYLKCHERDWVPDQEKIFSKKANFSWKEIYRIFKPFFDNSLQPLEQIFLADFNGKLRHNFSIVSASVNAHFGINTISPLLSKKMISYATHIPLDLKYDKHSNTGKILLRQIIKKDGLEKFVSKSKLGFSINTVNLWNSYGKDICNHYLSSARIVQDDWIDAGWMNKKLQSNDNDVRTINKLLGLLAFEIWYRLFITKEMKPHTRL